MKKLATLLLLLAAPALAAPYHTADTAPDYLISLSELLRVIQFYNVGALHCEAGTEDAFAPGVGETACAPHDSDYAPQDWSVSLSELLRLIQFYNTPGYHPCAGSEDGYCAGVPTVNLADPELERVLRLALNKPVDPLTPTDLAGLTELSAPAEGITDLTGLDLCTNLTILDLNNNCIADLSPLAQLTHLEILNLHNNAVASLAPLSTLTNLRLLWLDHNLINDPAPLKNNPGLATNDRIALAFNPLGAANAAQDLADLRARGASVWSDTPPGAAPASCANTLTPGDPIPLDVHLIHGDPALDDANAFVLLLFGDAYTEDLLDDPMVTVADVPANGYGSAIRTWSKSAADAIHFLLSEEPFTEYASYFKVYRVDLISNEAVLSDNRTVPPTVHDTALNMANESLAFSFDDAQIHRLADATGVPWDHIVLLPNADGSGKNLGDITEFSNARFSRTMTGLHELGHGIGKLTDEYEWKHGTNPPTSEAPGTRAFANAISTGTGIPTLDDIPWKHWLADVCPAPNTHLGEAVDYNCLTEACQCDASADFMNCVPLPTCEPGGNYVDANGKIYGRSAWPEPDETTPVGLYEGAWFRTKGAYRPELRCRMRSDDDVEPGLAETTRFCKVCREALTLEIVENTGSAATILPGNATPVPVNPNNGTLQFSILPHVPATPGHQIEVLSWALDTATLPGETATHLLLDPTGLEPATQHTLTVTLIDRTPFVLPNYPEGQQRLTQEITWTLTIE